MLLSPPPPQKDLYPETKRDRYQRGGRGGIEFQEAGRGKRRFQEGGGGIVRITEEREKYLPPTLQEVNLGCSYPKAAKSIDWRLPVN